MADKQSRLRLMRSQITILHGTIPGRTIAALPRCGEPLVDVVDVHLSELERPCDHLFVISPLEYGFHDSRLCMAGDSFHCIFGKIGSCGARLDDMAQIRQLAAVVEV